jgi:nucleoside-diphosphate-sugar epimerase
MSRILITGANSFIGTNFIKNSKYKEIDEVSLFDFRPEQIDFSKYDVVLHLAAIVHKSKRIPESEYLAINKDLALTVAEHAKKAGVKQFVFLSTVKVYGRFIQGSDPWKEDSRCNPDDAYGRSKFQAELSLNKLADDKFVVSIIRTPIVYGPGVKANMLKFIKLIEKFPALPFAEVNNARYYTFIENLVCYVERIIELRMPGTFIAMDDNASSTTYLVRTISAVLNKNLILFRLPGVLVKLGVHLYPEFFDRLYNSLQLDNSQTKKVLNFTPPVRTEEGLKRTALSYLYDKGVLKT